MLMTASPEQHEPDLRRLIADWCSINAARSQERCRAKQTDSLERFLAIRQRLGDAEPQASERCLQQGARAPSVNWVSAARCLDRKYSVRLAKWAPPSIGPVVPPPPAFPWTPVLPQAGR